MVVCSIVLQQIITYLREYHSVSICNFCNCATHTPEHSRAHMQHSSRCHAWFAARRGFLCVGYTRRFNFLGLYKHPCTMFSSNYARYHLVVYRRFLCFGHSRVNFTPSMLSGNVFQWSKKNTPLIV